MFRNRLQYNMGFGEHHLQLAVVERAYFVERFWARFSGRFRLERLK